MINVILYGALGGTVYGLTSWAKTNEDIDIEYIDGRKLLRTVLIGTGLGAIAAYQGVTIDAAAATSALGFVTLIVDNGLKFIERKVLPRLL